MSSQSSSRFITFVGSRLPDELPAPNRAPVIGELLAATLSRALEARVGWRLVQSGQAHFRLETWTKDRLYELSLSWRHSRAGTLDQVLFSTRPGTVAPSRLRLAGIPAEANASAVAGDLALRLFRANGNTRIAIALDFRPWVAAHLRYRLHYVVKEDDGQLRQCSIHAASLEALLIAGLELVRSAAGN
jgi:hypothetical protein